MKIKKKRTAPESHYLMCLLILSPATYDPSHQQFSVIGMTSWGSIFVRYRLQSLKLGSQNKKLQTFVVRQCKHNALTYYKKT